MAKKAEESLLQPCKMVFRPFQAFARLQKAKKDRRQHFATLQKGIYDRFKRLQSCKRQKKAVDSILQRCKRAFTTVSGFAKRGLEETHGHKQLEMEVAAGKDLRICGDYVWRQVETNQIFSEMVAVGFVLQDDGAGLFRKIYREVPNHEVFIEQKDVFDRF